MLEWDAPGRLRLRTLILYHTDQIQDVKADWIASRFPVDGFVQVQVRRAPLPQYLWRRVKRYGLGKVASEMAWRVGSRLTERRQDELQMAGMVRDLRAALPAGYRRPPVHTLESINSPAGEALLRELKPDVCLIMLNVMLKKQIFTIPRHGMLIFHPGLVPEYRGVHCGFWAVANDDVARIGWSLLRIDEGVDTGPVLAQGVASTVDPARENYAVMQHKAQFEGMPRVVAALEALAREEMPRVETTGRENRNYTHPGFGDWLRYRQVLRRHRRAVAAAPVES